MVKELILRVLNGGLIATWEKETGVRDRDGPRNNPFIVALAKELEHLRNALFRSDSWGATCRHLMERQRERRDDPSVPEFRKTDDALATSAFSLVLQTIEHDILMAALASFRKSGLVPTAIIFDGATLLDCGQSAAALARAITDAENCVRETTGFRVEIVEKPLFGLGADPLRLLRSDTIARRGT